MHQKNQVDVGFQLDSLRGSWQFSPQNHSKPLISVDVFFVFFHTWISGIAFQDHSWADSSFLKLVSCMNVGREC
jgi:hypothetical protein